ncbi:MAG: hypothetical protein HDT43_11330 [Ruminococcaceae bacterium]|nr:hypothetical protein [Oscillospiraceae bacterium]
MKDKVFYSILTAVCIVGIISVIALVAYTYALYKDCSIISYIANRG